MRRILLVLSHAAALGVGFAAGIYALPILVAPKSPTAADVRAAAGEAKYVGEFRRDLKGSDLLHWGEGRVAVTPQAVTLAGKLAPGPDYKLYLSPQFVDTKEGFLRVKAAALRVGDVKTFENFVVAVPDSIDVSNYNTVIVWCEAFGQFISAARYR